MMELPEAREVHDISATANLRAGCAALEFDKMEIAIGEVFFVNLSDAILVTGFHS